MSGMVDAAPMMPLRIAASANAAEGIRRFELVHPDGADLPAFSPGSHLKVRVPNGAIRKYSLCNDPEERRHYVITVKREAAGQGGSISLVDSAKTGDTLAVAAPENAFPLAATASRHIFIAGGIGITPIMSMIRSFGEAPSAPWKLHYLTRSPETTAFLGELDAPEMRAYVEIHHDHGDPAKAFDLWPVLERPRGGAHIYCCGPRGLMEGVRDMAGHWPHSSVHFESFDGAGAPRADDRPFQVGLARSGGSFDVPVGETILSVLRAAGHTLASSCESGTCGTCRTGLVEGEADHRDMVLMPEETDAQIMICVSRAKSDRIVVDL